MHPNSFLKSLWRAETIDQVFVAMSFDKRFTSRFEAVIRPAVEAETISGFKLSAFRVDNSKSGDSILTEIVNGIAHSRIVLADVSVIDEGRYTDQPIRPGNVMYEVGVALACRLPSEVLLVRDDNKKFLFDVSTIPHMQVDFSDAAKAILQLRSALEDRIKETTLLNDARLQMMARTVTESELHVLQELAKLAPTQARDLTHPALNGMLSQPVERGVIGLLGKGCLRSCGINADSGGVFYALTPFGYGLANAVDKLLKRSPPDKPDPPAPPSVAAANDPPPLTR